MGMLQGVEINGKVFGIDDDSDLTIDGVKVTGSSTSYDDTAIVADITAIQNTLATTNIDLDTLQEISDKIQEMASSNDLLKTDGSNTMESAYIPAITNPDGVVTSKTLTTEQLSNELILENSINDVLAGNANPIIVRTTTDKILVRGYSEDDSLRVYNKSDFSFNQDLNNPSSPDANYYGINIEYNANLGRILVTDLNNVYLLDENFSVVHTLSITNGDWFDTETQQPIAFSDDYIAVGYGGYEHNFAGEIFTSDGTTQVAVLTDAGGDYAGFGASVALLGDYLISSGDHENTGGVAIVNILDESHIIIPSETAHGFGYRLYVVQDKILVASPGSNTIYTYDVQGNRGADIVSPIPGALFFGISLVQNGEYLYIADNQHGNTDGTVCIFDLNYNYLGHYQSDPDNSGFGKSMAVLDDNSIIVAYPDANKLQIITNPLEGIYTDAEYIVNSIRDTRSTLTTNYKNSIAKSKTDITNEYTSYINTKIQNIQGLPVHDDEATADTAGLVAGDVYRTSTGELRIKL